MKKTLVNYLGLLGIVSMLSYIAAMCFAPLGFSWIQLVCAGGERPLCGQCSVKSPLGPVCRFVLPLCTMCCVVIGRSYNKTLRLGVYLFAVMNWLSAVGYAMFPLTAAGLPSGFQNTMHLVVTAFVVLLLIVSLALIIAGGLKGRGTSTHQLSW